jgi:hypothetical protein
VRSAGYLLEVVAEVDHVVLHQKFQVQILTVWSVPYIPERIRVYMPNQFNELRVICDPEVDNFPPGPSLVPLDANPFIAIVSRQVDPNRQLKPHKPLMVICRGINQMAKDFFGRPFSGSRPDSRSFLPDLP